MGKDLARLIRNDATVRSHWVLAREHGLSREEWLERALVVVCEQKEKLIDLLKAMSGSRLIQLPGGRTIIYLPSEGEADLGYNEE